MQYLNRVVIDKVNQCLNRGNPVELHIEKEQVVVVELTRRVVAKELLLLPTNDKI